MKSVLEQTDTLIEIIRGSNQFNQYQLLLNKIMQDKPLYNRMNEFRRRNFILQMDNQRDVLDGSTELSKEFSDVLAKTEVKEFLSAEQRYVSMIRQIKRKLDSSLELNIDFLED